jgi:hypothetical protein
MRIAGRKENDDLNIEKYKCSCGGIFVKIEANTLSSIKLFEIEEICMNCGATRKAKK